MVTAFIQVNFIRPDDGCDDFWVAGRKSFTIRLFCNRIAGRNRVVAASDEYPPFRPLELYTVGQVIADNHFYAVVFTACSPGETVVAKGQATDLSSDALH